MEDLFERVYRYAQEDAENDWGYDWMPMTYETTNHGGIVTPENKLDDRLVYVFECNFRKRGHVPDDSERAAIFSEKEKIVERIRALNKEKSEYTYRMDYSAVKPLMSGSDTIGYDIVVRQRPYITLADYLKKPEMADFCGKLFSGKLAAEQVKSLNDKFTYYFILSDGKHFHKMLDAAIPSHSAIKLPAVSSGSWVQTGVAYGVEIQGTTWETVNLGAQYPWEYGNRYTWDDMLQDVRDGWHIPEYGNYGTTDGFRSILSCNRYWTSIKGINGCIYEDPNNANHFIFLPANGDWDTDNGVIKQIGESGNYWTSSDANYAYAYLLMFTEYDEQDIFSDSKDVLLGVRLVAD